MKTKVLFVERKFWEFVSIEKVFRQIAKNSSKQTYEYKFEKLKFGNNLLGITKNLLFYSPKKADVFHITGHIHYIALCLPKKKTILTIHDLGFLHNNTGIKRYILKKLFLDLPVKKLDFITTISDATKSEILKYTNCEKNKIRVIENPLPDGFKQSTNQDFNGDYPRVLQIGTAKHKNLGNLIRALTGIECELDIVGKLDEQQKKLLEKNKIDHRVSFDLTDKELIEKYRKADIISFCSTFEGFGLPIIEGQAMGKAVVTSKISPLKEVAGIGALLVDPFDYLDIRKAIKIIINDAEFRGKLIANGLENIKRFDSKNITSKYEDLYCELLKNE